MPAFQVVTSIENVPVLPKWNSSVMFLSKNRIVDINGKAVDGLFSGQKYQLIAKKERRFTFIERIINIAVAVFLVIGSLGIVLCFKTSRSYVFKLLIDDLKKIRFGVPYVPVSPVEHRDSLITDDKEDTDSSDGYVTAEE